MPLVSWFSITNSNANLIFPFIVQRLGTKLEKAFKDPIKEIKEEYGLIEEKFFHEEEEILLAGPFSKVTLLMTGT